MKKIAVMAVLAAGFCLAGAQAQDTTSSVAGKWNIHASIAGNESDSFCTFTQTGNDLAGTCSGSQGEVKVAGKMDGKTVTWSASLEYNGTPLTIKYEGTLDSGKLAGTVTVDPYGVSGDFSGTPATDAAVPAAAPTADAGSSSVGGKWKVHTSIAGNEGDAACTITQTDNDLTGTCVSEQGTVKISGKVNGKKVIWSYSSEHNGSPLTVKYNGTLDAGKIIGDATVDPFGVSGEFTATPAS